MSFFWGARLQVLPYRIRKKNFVNCVFKRLKTNQKWSLKCQKTVQHHLLTPTRLCRCVGERICCLRDISFQRRIVRYRLFLPLCRNTFHKIGVLAKEADLDLPDRPAESFQEASFHTPPCYLSSITNGPVECPRKPEPRQRRTLLRRVTVGGSLYINVRSFFFFFFFAAWVMSIEVFTWHARAHSRFCAWALTCVFNPVCTSRLPFVLQVDAARGASIITLSAAGVGVWFRSLWGDFASFTVNWAPCFRSQDDTIVLE